VGQAHRPGTAGKLSPEGAVYVIFSPFRAG